MLYQLEPNGRGVVNLYITKNNLIKELGMVNELYQDVEVNQKLPEVDKRFTPYQINTFYTRSVGNLSAIVKNALKSLQSQKLIRCEEQWVASIAGRPKQIKKKYYTEIMNCEFKVLQKHGYETPYPFLIHGKMKEYYDEVSQQIKQDLFPQIDWVYKRYKISAVKESLPIGIDQNLNSRRNLIYETKKNLNQKVINRMDTEAKDHIDRYGFFENFDDQYFLSTQNDLCSYLIDLDMSVDKFDALVEERRQNVNKNNDLN